MRRLHGLVGCLLVLGCSALPDVARAVCGDGILEREYELCDDGAANGSNGCCTTSCDFVDQDGDGICDAQDPCGGASGILGDVALVVKGFTTPPGDDTFRLTATLASDAPVDLARTGFAFVLGNRFFGSFAHAAIPGGKGWRVAAHGGWSYRDPAGTAGLTSVKLRGQRDGTFALEIRGRRGSYAAWADIRPISLAVALAASTASPDACGESFLSLSRCVLSGADNTLRCSPPPPLRRCGGTTDDHVRCDAQNAVAMEEAYFAVHGEYYSGDCIGLPGFTPSPGVLCVASGDNVIYSLVTASPYGTVGFACVYSSNPDHPGDPNLVCS
jgi:hypothetical protein